MSAEVIPLKPPTQTEPKCSFCGTPQSKAKKFISSGDGTKHICGDCIVKAKQRLEESRHQPT